MSTEIDRRGFLRRSAMLGGCLLAGSVPFDRSARAAAVDLEHVIPMHCSGPNFIELAKREMPEKLVLCGNGTSFTFTA